MSMTICSEKSGPISADIEIPETCETSSGIFTQTIKDNDQLIDHDPRNTSCEERKRNQTVIDLTTDDDDVGPNTLGPDLRDLRPTTPNVASTIFYDSSAIYDADADAATSLLGQFSHDLAPSMPIE